MTITYAATSGNSGTTGPGTRNEPARAVAFFAARLEFQTDVSDVHAGLRDEAGAEAGAGAGDEAGAPAPGFVLIDTRSHEAWDQGHIPGAVHLPTAEIAARAAELLDPAVPVVTYCWGPGCNGSTRAALALALAGYSVKEMIGGVEYWVREGLPLRTRNGDIVADADPLTVPVAGAACGC